MKRIKELRDLSKITVEYVEDPLLPARVTAYRKGGGVVEAGDRFLRLAVINLMFLLTNERVPKIICEQLLTIEERVDSRIFEVL